MKYLIKRLIFLVITNKRIVVFALLLATQFMVGFYADVNAADPPTAPNTPLTYGKVSTSLCTVTNWMFSILIILSVMTVLAAAYMYVTAGGSAEKVGTATKTITYAAIGVAVALFARGFPFLVASILGSDISAFCGGTTSGGGGGSTTCPPGYYEAGGTCYPSSGGGTSGGGSSGWGM